MTADEVFSANKKELLAMIRWARRRGVDLPQEVVTLLNTSEKKCTFANLEEAHKRMAAAISPALPYSVSYITAGGTRACTEQGFFAMLPNPPVLLLRNLMLLLLSFLLLLPGLLLFGLRTDTGFALDERVTEIDDNWSMALTMAFIISAAGVGASFESLFRAMRYVEEGTYLPDYEFTYWARIILGMVAGLILAGFIPTGESTTAQFSTALLAILGGFSAIAVYRMLRRLIQTVETLVGHDAARTIQAEFDAEAARTENIRRREMSRATVLASELKAKLEHEFLESSDHSGLNRLAGELLALLQGESSPSNPTSSGPNEIKVI